MILVNIDGQCFCQFNRLSELIISFFFGGGGKLEYKNGTKAGTLANY